jgi:ABC-type nitrate/sulfonate/bicarbonate transport system substrate-binding protein
MWKLDRYRHGVRMSLAGAAGVVLTVAFVAGSMAQSPLKGALFVGPSPLYDSIQMADSQGFLKQEGLDLTFQLFPSGTTALQTFLTGEGDLVTHGDLPGVNHWIRANKNFRAISVIERGFLGYLVTARKEIKSPKDLIGKTVATRVGSTGSWFISEYLGANGIKASDVEVINLDTQVLPTALCRGDIAAFFIWEPFGSRALEVCPDRVHTLSNAKGYINGYAVVSARPGWLATAQGREMATRFLRAMLKGAQFAEKNFDAVAKYNADKFGLSEKATRFQWEINGRHIGFDEVFFKDYCSLAGWMRDAGLMKGPFDVREFIWTDGLMAIDPKLVAKIPDPC